MSMAGWLLLVAAAASTWPCWRYVVWSWRRGRPMGAAAILLGVLALLAAVTAAMVAGLPELLLLVGIVGTQLLLAARRRPTWGRRRGLPPGPLRWFDIAVVDDQWALADLFRQHGPVVKVANSLPVRRVRPTVCIAGLERGASTLGRGEADLRVPGLPSNDGVPLGFLRTMEGERHERYASLIGGALAVAREPLRDQHTRDHVIRWLAAADLSSGWHPRHVAGPLVNDLLRLPMLGVDSGTAFAERLEFALAAIRRRDRRWVPVRVRRSVFGRAIDLVLDHEAELASGSVLVEALRRGRVDGLDDRAVVGNVLQMYSTGRHDTAGLLAWTLLEFGRHPEHQAHIRSAIGQGRPDAVLAHVREVLRLHQSEYLLRVTRRPIDIDGHRIPTGWLIRVCVAESHRDATVFDRPDDLVPDRFLVAAPERQAYMPFGNGAHRCLGSGVAIATVCTVLEELTPRWEVRLVHDGPNDHDGAHWVPGGGVRLQAVPHLLHPQR